MKNDDVQMVDENYMNVLQFLHVYLLLEDIERDVQREDYQEVVQRKDAQEDV